MQDVISQLRASGTGESKLVVLAEALSAASDPGNFQSVMESLQRHPKRYLVGPGTLKKLRRIYGV